ncbi:MAG: hypothetical protein NTW66_00980 [Candidatus Magasanikbacteria bacterium]|nr:hypothetical protein [Candidatus Magasanikbacteria bacterium]
MKSVEIGQFEAKKSPQPEKASAKEAVERENTQERETVSKFKDHIELKYLESGAANFFSTMEKIMALGSPEKSGSVEISPEVLQELSSAGNRIHKRYRENYNQWLKEQLADAGSDIGVMAKELTMIGEARKIMGDKNVSNNLMQFVREGKKINSKNFIGLTERIENIYKALGDLAKKTTMDDVVLAFYIYLIERTIDEYKNKPKSLKEKIFGRKLPDAAAQARGFYDEAYAYSDRPGTDIDNLTYFESNILAKIGRKEPGGKIVSPHATLAADVRKCLGTIEKNFNGNPIKPKETDMESAPVYNIDKFAEASGYGPGYKKAIEAMLPIISDSQHVSSLNFKNESKGGTLGEYGLIDRSISIFRPEKPISARESAKVVGHELGHALRPETILSLPDAYRWQLGISATCSDEFSGYLTNYSENAVGIYAGNALPGILHAMTRPTKEGEKFMRQIVISDYEEEWAEITGFAVATPDILKKTCPEKDWFVKDTAKKLGLDIEAMAKKADLALSEDEQNA